MSKQQTKQHLNFMENKSVTAVEWLIEQLKTKYDIDIERLSVTDKAKAMHEQQIIDAFADSRFLSITNNCNNAEQYYNETYNTNHE
jgi:hypothetical protein